MSVLLRNTGEFEKLNNITQFTIGEMLNDSQVYPQRFFKTIITVPV